MSLKKGINKICKGNVRIQEGTTFDHNFYVVVGKQCCTENVYAGHQHNIFI